MKFLHAADIHLDSALAGLRTRDAVPAHVTQHCTRKALATLIDLAISEDVAFLVIAGDLYDGDWRDFSTGLCFANEMRRLARPCFLVRGNHDASSVISSSLELPPNVRLFSSRNAETLALDEMRVALHGRSFPERKVPEDLSASYPPPLPGRLNIGVLHTSAEDPGEHETYAPCSVQSLALKGYDYWALGHIHQRRVLHERPWIVFPGNTQGRNPRESGPKGATLVEVQDGRIVAVQHRDTDVLRWAQLAVDCGGADSMAEIAARVRSALSHAHQQADARPVIVRLTLAGATAQHAALLADRDAIDAECRNAALAVSGDLHIERLRLETRADAAGAEALGAVAQLAEAFRAGLDDPDLCARLLDDFRGLAGAFPRLAGTLPQDAAGLRALLPDAWHLVSHALASSGA